MKTKQATMFGEIIEIRKRTYLSSRRTGGNTTKLASAWFFFTGTAELLAEVVGGRVRQCRLDWDYQAGEWTNPILLND